jgi:DNA-binding NarL/FixJ family response regulator
VATLGDFETELAKARSLSDDAPLASTATQTRSELVKPRVLIVDEHGVLSDGIRGALELSGVQVLGIVSTTNGAVAALSSGLADAVILCVRIQKGTAQPAAVAAPNRDRPVGAAAQSIFAPGLTSREREVLRLLVNGASNKDMAKRLSIRSNTVRTHVQNLLAKLRVHTRLEAVTLAIRGGMLDPDERTDVSH